MTEDSFQEGRKFMQKANHIRGLITKAKGDVAKWTRIEGVHRENGNIGQAEGASKMLNISLNKLESLQKRFAEMRYPSSDIVKKIIRCSDCGSILPEITADCETCLNS